MERNDIQEQVERMLEEMRDLTGQDLVVYSADGEWIAGVPEDETSVLRRILAGEIPEKRAENICRRFTVRFDRLFLFVVRYRQDPDGILTASLRNLLSDEAIGFVIEMDASRTVLLADETQLENLTPGQYADMIVDNLQAEAMTNVWVGYGDPVTSADQLAAAYQNACTALAIGMIFYAEEQSYSYQQLGIARLIYQLPEDLCEMFLAEVLGENRDLVFDEETMNTINTLFSNNLNISETARQLYIHRNTLVYRLERINKQLGLDIRTFEDAMLFKIAMMVRTHLNGLHVEK